MKDRVPTYPGRVKLTPVSGQANTYDMERADQPVQEGTPLNKANLLTDETAAKIWPDSTIRPSNPSVNDALNKIASTDTFKVGDTLLTARSDLGDKWALCNGQLLEVEPDQEISETLGDNPALLSNDSVRVRSDTTNDVWCSDPVLVGDYFYFAYSEPNAFDDAYVTTVYKIQKDTTYLSSGLTPMSVFSVTLKYKTSSSDSTYYRYYRSFVFEFNGSIWLYIFDANNYYTPAKVYKSDLSGNNFVESSDSFSSNSYRRQSILVGSSDTLLSYGTYPADYTKLTFLYKRIGDTDWSYEDVFTKTSRYYTQLLGVKFFNNKWYAFISASPDDSLVSDKYTVRIFEKDSLGAGSWVENTTLLSSVNYMQGNDPFTYVNFLYCDGYYILDFNPVSSDPRKCVTQDLTVPMSKLSQVTVNVDGTKKRSSSYWFIATHNCNAVLLSDENIGGSSLEISIAATAGSFSPNLFNGTDSYAYIGTLIGSDRTNYNRSGFPPNAISEQNNIFAVMQTGSYSNATFWDFSIGKVAASTVKVPTLASPATGLNYYMKVREDT